ncbi:MAG: family 10 glycosylhydrolase [Planctomycetes bacterium]|nr:family 10 glycosylhydrolase [Planctomycetota bacterium]
MPIPLLSLLCLLSTLAACSLRAPAQNGAGSAPTAPPPLPREFRGAWVATVNNIDFPSRRGLGKAQLQAELDAIVARAAELRLNALVFQVRPCADAFYRSPLEPWSEWLSGTQGKAPEGDFDPLAYVIDRCHRQGLQLHAWFNPYRARHKSASKSAEAKSHVSQQAPQLVVQYGGYHWMDPGEPLAADWSLAVIQDVVKRYDVDGVHIDDYFYPYPEPKQEFPDDASYARYRNGGGKLGKADWRRQNIDTFVRRMYAVVHEAKPHVAVGISPFGIARPGVPAGIKAGVDQYAQLYADVPKWLREGWLDYLAPQLYWPIDQTAQSFPVLLSWWHGQNPKQRAIWPGLATYKMLPIGKGWRAQELTDQIGLVRAADRNSGHIHYSFASLRSDAAHVGGALRGTLYREVALPPAMGWLRVAAPKPPELRARDGQLEWTADGNSRLFAVQVRTAGGWRTLPLLGGESRSCALPDDATDAVVTAMNGAGALGRSAVVKCR